jgi:DNA-binding LacI/PurR family transcriptional regulator
MEDVALRAGVSRAVVSIVFRDQPGAGNETRARVRAAAAEIGYWPDARAQLLSRKQTRLVGVSFAVGREFHADLVTELYAAAQDSGYELVLSGVTPDRREQRAAQDLLAFRCDAMILPGPSTRLADLAAIGRQTPTVVLARAATAEGIDVVRTDDVRGFCRQHPRCRFVELVLHYSNLLPGPETLAELRDRANARLRPANHAPSMSSA